jgi:hypothetical protein
MEFRPLPLIITDHKIFNISNTSPTLTEMHGPFATDQPYNLIMLARMLAKVAHSFAVAEIGEENFLPYLKPIILGSDLSYVGSVIGQTKAFPENTPLEAHHIALRCLPGISGSPVDGEWVTVGIKMFSGHSEVTYSVVAGKLTPTPTYLKWKGVSKLPPDQLAALRRHYGILP